MCKIFEYIQAKERAEEAKWTTAFRQQGEDFVIKQKEHKKHEVSRDWPLHAASQAAQVTEARLFSVDIWVVDSRQPCLTMHSFIFLHDTHSLRRIRNIMSF